MAGTWSVRLVVIGSFAIPPSVELTVADKLGSDVKRGTLASIRRRASLREES
jgi:hypothetical protein